jgi:hypothetical protein
MGWRGQTGARKVIDILPDTTAWIDYYNPGSDTPAKQKLSFIPIKLPAACIQLYCRKIAQCKRLCLTSRLNFLSPHFLRRKKHRYQWLYPPPVLFGNVYNVTFNKRLKR